jgi:hypothetical protein
VSAPLAAAPAANAAADGGSFLVAQYEALRAEILMLMSANEARTFAALGFAATVWAALAALLGNAREVPGAAFLAPLPVLLHAFNNHIVYSRRVANLGSFLAAMAQRHFAGVLNWESEVGRFARTSGIRMSSRLPIAAVYWFAVLFGAAAAIVRAAIANSAGPRPGDLAISIAVSALAVLAQVQIHRGYSDFATAREQFDRYWSSRLGS